jgi:hypothetical protein
MKSPGYGTAPDESGSGTRLRGGSSVAVALYATAGLVSEHVRFLGARLCLRLTRMDCGPAVSQGSWCLLRNLR